MTKAVFLDRDGTINHDDGYIGNPNLIKLYDGVADGIKFLKNNLGFKIIVISNQSGISRGLITHEDVKRVNEKINQILSEQNTCIDKFYYCPYHPDYDSFEKCRCRKPSPEMVLMAAKENNINLNNSFFIGDKSIDVECAKNAGVISILLKNTLNNEEINVLKNSKNSPNFIASNFQNAVSFIERSINGEIVEEIN
jgi:D-glycero-D-manno-heptose 1,7-bisphosphate phosphatase